MKIQNCLKCSQLLNFKNQLAFPKTMLGHSLEDWLNLLCSSSSQTVFFQRSVRCTDFQQWDPMCNIAAVKCMPTIMFAPPHASNKWLPLEVVLFSQMYSFSIHFSLCVLLECYRYLMVWCNSYTWILNHPLGHFFGPIWVGFLFSLPQWGLTGDHGVTYFCGALVTIYTSGKGASEIGIVYTELHSGPVSGLKQECCKVCELDFLAKKILNSGKWGMSKLVETRLYHMVSHYQTAWTGGIHFKIKIL